MSVNDSEELSSPASEDDDGGEEEEEEVEEEGEEEKEEEEEEDSGSEVEIIDEVQGNGRLPPLQPGSVLMQEEHAHFLQDLSEQQVAEFSLMAPSAEMKVTTAHQSNNDLPLAYLSHTLVVFILNVFTDRGRSRRRGRDGETRRR